VIVQPCPTSTTTKKPRQVRQIAACAWARERACVAREESPITHVRSASLPKLAELMSYSNSQNISISNTLAIKPTQRSSAQRGAMVQTGSARPCFMPAVVTSARKRLTASLNSDGVSQYIE
jgi:hypothetical protein